MEIGSTVQGNVNIENPKTQDESQIIHQTNLGNGSVESFTVGILTGKRKKKKGKEKHLNDAQKEMDARLSENLDEGNVAIENPKVLDEPERLGKTQINAESTENFTDRTVIIENSKTHDDAQSMDRQKMGTLKPAENLAQGNVNGKRRKKRKKTKKAKVNDKACSEMETRPTETIVDGDIVIKDPIQDEAQSMLQNKMDICRPAENLPQGNAPGKQRKKRKKKKAAKCNEEIHSETHTKSTENLSKGNPTINNLEINDEVQNVSPVPAEGNVNIKNPKCQDEVQSTDQAKMDTGPKLNFAEGNVAVKRKRKRKKTKKAKILDEGIGHAEQCGISTCNEFDLKDAKALCLKTGPNRRKLLVLDINGLLADIVHPAPKNCTPDIKINGRAVFRRSFCDDFLEFCFQNFYVGIWSSRSKKIVDKVVDYLLVDKKHKLQFCWDMTHSTQTGFRTLEKHYKPLVCKELRRIWENDDPNCPWRKGDYNESNTLLLDDSPYKALINPLHTAIFPSPYQYSDKNDNSLGPGGDLRVYLEGVLTSENVQKYVQQHPFGQKSITEESLSWGFYKQVLEKFSNPVKDKTPVTL